MKRLKSNYKIGLLLLIALAIGKFLLDFIWSIAHSFGEAVGFQFIDNSTINTAIYLLILAVAIPPFLGFLLSVRYFGDFIYRLLASIPVCSFFAKFIPRGEEEIRDLENFDFKEVMVDCNGFWICGLFVRDVTRGDRRFSAIYLGSCPIFPTGYLVFIPEEDKDRIYYTGRTNQDYSATVMSWGVR
ncbi:MAG: hypothetical protein Q8O87_04090 [bacterium]|nr:hypothetical protein [bacterium]